jgi:hypothetical protein
MFKLRENKPKRLMGRFSLNSASVYSTMTLNTRFNEQKVMDFTDAKTLATTK